jgi:hypothetical protein
LKSQTNKGKAPSRAHFSNRTLRNSFTSSTASSIY